MNPGYRGPKPCVRSKIDKLPADQRSRVHKLMREAYETHVPYKRLVTQIHDAVGVKISPSSLSDYFQTRWAEIFHVSPPVPTGSEVIVRLEIRPVLVFPES